MRTLSRVDKKRLRRQNCSNKVFLTGSVFGVEYWFFEKIEVFRLLAFLVGAVPNFCFLDRSVFLNLPANRNSMTLVLLQFSVLLVEDDLGSFRGVG